MTEPSHGPWYYQQIGLGYNYRMTDIQAALGLSQMRRLDEFVARRHSIVDRYANLLSGLPVAIPWQHADGYSGLHLYVISLKLDQISRTHRDVFEGLRRAGIGANLHYIPVHLQPYYQNLGFKAGDFPAAERYYSSAISLPLFPALTNAQQDKVVDTLNALLS